jgi:hypothetical protein
MRLKAVRPNIADGVGLHLSTLWHLTDPWS